MRKIGSRFGWLDSRGGLGAVVAFGVVLLAGCAGPKLADTPNLFLDTQDNPFADVPPALQGNDVELHYFTDRQPIEKDGELSYGFERSRSLAFGTCRISIGDDVPWETLVKESRTDRRSTMLPLRVTEIDELVRAPDSVTSFVEIDGQFTPTSEVVKAREVARRAVENLLGERLELSPRKELFVFVHGFNNTFEEAALRMAQLWHFLGRVGVPIIYTWPAGRPGLLRGYNYDRESSEFTILHLREALRFLADCDDVEKIHIIAHSRGADVAMSALRELHLEYRGAGLDTRSALKLGTVILAAADLDLDVVGTRIVADGLHHVPETLTIYLSDDDRALGVASWLFSSVRRLGQLTFGKAGAKMREESSPGISLVNVKFKSDWLGHGYFISNPAVLSDLILLLRDGRPPGSEHGRPLRFLGGQFWELDESYPQFEK